MSNSTVLYQLPNSLNLPPHLSAYKYFMVCSLTVAAWDTLVLSPRTWRLLRAPGWPALKVIFNFLRVFMPVEFVVVG
jgi:small neutral amino acid transporter SnatA (MarC family)